MHPSGWWEAFCKGQENSIKQFYRVQTTGYDFLTVQSMVSEKGQGYGEKPDI